jgi:hypothetical protein
LRPIFQERVNNVIGKGRRDVKEADEMINRREEHKKSR